jgi:hypothetical protein
LYGVPMYVCMYYYWDTGTLGHGHTDIMSEIHS